MPGWLADATDWRSSGHLVPAGRYVERLADRYTVIAVDPLGHGRSQKPHDRSAYEFPDLAADIIAPLDAAAIDRAIVWGYSRGAYLAAVAAAEFPERVAGLILGGNPLTHQGWPEDWSASLASGDWANFWALDPFGFPLDRSWAQENDPLALAAQTTGETLSLKNYRFDLARIQCPALLYCGGNHSPETMRETADRLGVHLHIVEGLDHVQTFVEADRVLQFVLPFIAAQSPTTTPGRRPLAYP